MDRQSMWLWLTSLPTMDSRKITCLMDKLGDIEEIYNGDNAVYNEVEGIARKDISELCNKSMGRADEIIIQVKLAGARIVCYDEPEYPYSLRQIYDPPYVLYMKGTHVAWDRIFPIAMVGSRVVDKYAIEVSNTFARQLAKSGATIISGMALGVDGICQNACIKSGGTTVAVLGCGIDVVYPPEHKDLMDVIIENGVVISEFPPSTPPDKKNFPKRNRIISGLSKCTVVIGAPMRSGSLITADIALNEGKEVYCVPSNINNPRFEGSNNLIKQGAKLLDRVADILDDFYEDFKYIDRSVIEQKREQNASLFIEIHTRDADKERAAKDKKLKPRQVVKPELTNIKINNVKSVTIDDEKYLGLSEEEKGIISSIIETTKHIDTISQECEIPVGKLGAMLTILEMKSLVRSMPNRHYAILI